jgi:hydrogenase maturation protease
MSAPGRIVGLGQRAAGDDGVGIAVLDWLRRQGVAPGIELAEIWEASGLGPLLESPGPVVLVDAVLAPPPGRILELAPAALDDSRSRPVSSHGIGVADTIALARLLAPDRLSPAVRLVGITIARPRRHAASLSPTVAAAVPEAAARALALATAA